MNFLAHFFLSCEDESLLIGNFLADFISNREVKQLPQAVQEGVALHRKIDHFTDNHPRFRSSVRQIRPQHGKYAPVLLDVYYDYLLSQNWDRYGKKSLDNFVEDVYEILLANRELMPDFMRDRVSMMVADNWLRSYSTSSGLRRTFQRMKRRLSKPGKIEGAVETLQQHRPSLEPEFLSFFPDAIAFVRSECA